MMIDVSSDFNLAHPFLIRSDSEADKGCLGQIFQGGAFDIERYHQGRVARAYYNHILRENKIPVILDLGANIGAASRFLSIKYPEAAIIAVEPDEENAKICKLNTTENILSPSNIRRVVTAAVGSENGSLFLADHGMGEWGYQVDTSGDKPVEVLDVPSLLRELPSNVMPFLAKIDIEGGEKDLFSKNYSWVYDFAVVILEIHDWLHPFEHCTSPLQRVFAAKDYDQIFKGENIYFFSYEHLRKHHNPYKKPIFG